MSSGMESMHHSYMHTTHIADGTDVGDEDSEVFGSTYGDIGAFACAFCGLRSSCGISSSF